MSEPVRIGIVREHVAAMLDGAEVNIRETPVGPLNVAAVPDLPWVPLVLLEPLPVGILRGHEVTGQTPPVQVWSNGVYEVFVYILDPELPLEEAARHLSIKRLDRVPIRNWRHLQQIKNEVCGEFCEGLELFPSEERIADNANQYHLFVMPLGVRLPFGYGGGMVVRDDEDVAAYNANGDPGRQEPWQEGLTVGEKMNEAQKSQLPPDAMEARDRIMRGDLAPPAPNRQARRKRR